MENQGMDHPLILTSFYHKAFKNYIYIKHKMNINIYDLSIINIKII